MQRPGDLRRHIIGVDVVAFPALPHAHGSDNGNIAALQHIAENRRRDRLDLADIANVDAFNLPLTVNFSELLSRPDQVAVLAGKADRVITGLAQAIDDFRIHLADENHLGDGHRFFIRHAQPADKL